MATLEQRVLEASQAADQPLDDDALALLLGVRRQAVNQLCRGLAAAGRIDRRPSESGKIANTLAAGGRVATGELAPASVPAAKGPLLSEDEVKAAVHDHLEAAGYRVTVMWGRQRGVDIEAIGPQGRLLIEAKGEVALQPQQVNYFVGALGELVQRMDDPSARYGLALPDNKQYRGLVGRLRTYAREHLGLIVFFVRRDREGLQVRREG